MIFLSKKGISPRKPGKCRFIPTCSEYAKICYERFNFAYASFLTAKRIFKMHSFFTSVLMIQFPRKKKKEELSLLNFYLKHITMPFFIASSSSSF
ncbi:MAG: membrane protein insertion efficiency factor YidD [Clostridium sp.]|nr:MAG: membrane protein insertion efficiency factor YidD [Clostridium sp.]